MFSLSLAKSWSCREKQQRRVFALLDCWKSDQMRTKRPQLHLFSDSELEALHQLFLLEALKVLMQVFLPSWGVRYKVAVLMKENHRLLSHTEE